MVRIKFTNKKGEHLAGLLFRADNPDTPVVVVCHGFTGSKEGHGKAVAMGHFLKQNGIACLLFDFAGCGESEGKFEDITLSGHIGDLTCAVDYCLAEGLGPVFTMGRSFGGTTAICQAASDRRVAGVCTWAAPSSLWELFINFTDGELPEDENEKVPLADDEGIIYLKKTFFTDLSLHNVPRCASLISPRPLLVVQGTRDDLVPVTDASIIYNAAGDPREIALIEGADHQFSTDYEKVWGIMLGWLKKLI